MTPSLSFVPLTQLTKDKVKAQIEGGATPAPEYNETPILVNPNFVTFVQESKIELGFEHGIPILGKTGSRKVTGINIVNSAPIFVVETIEVVKAAFKAAATTSQEAK